MITNTSFYWIFLTSYEFISHFCWGSHVSKEAFPWERCIFRRKLQNCLLKSQHFWDKFRSGILNCCWISGSVRMVIWKTRRVVQFVNALNVHPSINAINNVFTVSRRTAMDVQYANVEVNINFFNVDIFIFDKASCEFYEVFQVFICSNPIWGELDDFSFLFNSFQYFFPFHSYGLNCLIFFFPKFSP